MEEFSGTLLSSLNRVLDSDGLHGGDSLGMGR